MLWLTRYIKLHSLLWILFSDRHHQLWPAG